MMPLNKLFFNPNIVASNWSGTLGAFLAQRFMYKWIGLPAFTLIIVLSTIAMKLLKLKTWPIGRTIKLSIAYSIWGSVALGYIFHHSAFVPGGANGFFVSEWMNAIIGKLGTGIVLATVLFVILSFTFDNFISRTKLFAKNLLAQKVVESDLPVDEENEEQPESESLTSESEDDAQASDTADDEQPVFPESDEEPDINDIETDSGNNQDADLLKFEITTTTTVEQSDSQEESQPLQYAFDNLNDIESKLIDDNPTNDEYTNDNQFEIIDTTKNEGISGRTNPAPSARPTATSWG